MATIHESAVANTLREELLPTIYELGGPHDPVFSMARRSWTNVVRDKGLGRNLKVKKVWGIGLAGGGNFGSALGSEVLSGPQNFQVFGAPETWPGLDEMVIPTFPTTEVQLIKQKLNVPVPRDILQSDAMDASIGPILPHIIKGFGNLAMQMECSAFYSTAPSTVALAAIGDTSATVTNVSGDTTAINIDLNGTDATGRIHRFEKGMLVDLYDSTGTTKRNANFQVFVDNVDRAGQVIRLRRLDGNSLQVDTVLGGGVSYDGTGGDDDIIVMKDSLGFTPGTMESWIADGTTITDFFGIDVRNLSDFKSIREDLSSNPLTEGLLNEHVGYFYESFPNAVLDKAITTNGVLLSFIDNLDNLVQGTDVANPGRYRYERNGKPVTIEAGWNSFNYRFGGAKITFYTSRYAEKGAVTFGKFDITRFIPPPIPGAATDRRVDGELQFVGAVDGSPYQGIFVPLPSTNGRFTNFMQAPCERKSVMMPGQPNFLKLTSAAEPDSF